MKVSRVLLVCLLVVILLGIGCFLFLKYNPSSTGKNSTATTTQQKVAKDQVVIGESFLATGIYPNCAYESQDLNFSSNIFQSLVSFDPENKIVPSLATKWDNPDNLTWRFYLSPEAKFSNGDSVTADDVKFTYDYVQSSQYQTKYGLPVAESIKVDDSTTIEFKTAKPNPIFLNSLATGFFILSKKEIEANGVKNNIGSGPYVLQSSSTDQIVLSVNTNYWKTEPLVSRAIFKLIPVESDLLTALLNGSIDIIGYGGDPASVAKVDSAVAAGTIQEINVLQPGVSYLAIDSLRAKSPYITGTPDNKNPLQDIRVRKALVEAIDIGKYVKGLSGKNVPINQMVSQGIFGYNSTIERSPFNLDGAKELMKEAGYPDGFTITVDYVDYPAAKATVVPIADMLSKISVTVKLNAVNQNDFFQKIGSRDSSAYVIAYSTSSMDASEVLDLVLHTPNDQYGSNNLGYSNLTVDKLTEEADSTIDQQTRLQKMQEAMKIAMDDVATIPLAQTYYQYAAAKDVFLQSRADAMLKVDELAGIKN